MKKVMLFLIFSSSVHAETIETLQQTRNLCVDTAKITANSILDNPDLKKKKKLFNDSLEALDVVIEKALGNISSDNMEKLKIYFETQARGDKKLAREYYYNVLYKGEDSFHSQISSAQKDETFSMKNSNKHTYIDLENESRGRDDSLKYTVKFCHDFIPREHNSYYWEPIAYEVCVARDIIFQKGKLEFADKKKTVRATRERRTDHSVPLPNSYQAFSGFLAKDYVYSEDQFVDVFVNRHCEDEIQNLAKLERAQEVTREIMDSTRKIADIYLSPISGVAKSLGSSQ